MMQSSQIIDVPGLQKTMVEIENLISTEKLTTLEAVSCYLEQNSIPESAVSKVIPAPIIERIRQEALDEQLLRPSIIKTTSRSNLDFLLDG